MKNTPEPVTNFRNRHHSVEYDVDPDLSHFTVNSEYDTTGLPFDNGDKVETTHIDYYEGDWLIDVAMKREDSRYGYEHYKIPATAVAKWHYESAATQKAEKALEHLEEAQDLLDDIWGDTGGKMKSEELTKRVNQTRDKLERELDT